MNNVMLAKLKFFDIFSEENASSLASGFRFSDDNGTGLIFEILLEIVILCGERPSFRVEVILVCELFLHFNDVASEVVFA